MAVHTSASASPGAGVGWRLQEPPEQRWHKTLVLDSSAVVRRQLPRKTDNLLLGKTGWQLCSTSRSEKEEMGRGRRNGKISTYPVFRGEQKTNQRWGRVGT